MAHGTAQGRLSSAVRPAKVAARCVGSAGRGACRMSLGRRQIRMTAREQVAGTAQPPGTRASAVAERHPQIGACGTARSSRRATLSD
eukprot:scaffold2607_cov118-Isochrysis_galbana.AAC.4